ncbi:uncharacterized protein LOC119733122 [Patiria miniata]|uniref:HECT domain-containing protein n=1 Tax=Patiria miniata TaxID=46514 RepID=A0A914AGH8_PATMI|nr:uncharacterized protein LOC119733122 [Patiria miniata]
MTVTLYSLSWETLDCGDGKKRRLTSELDFSDDEDLPQVSIAAPVRNTSPAPSTSTVSQPPTTSTVSQPPTTSTVSQPPTTSTVSQPPTTSTVSQPPTTSTVSQPPTTSTVSQPPTTSTVSQPPTTSTVSQPPTTSRARALAFTSPTTSTVSQPPTTSTVSQPPTTSTVTRPPTTSTVTWPPTTSTVTRPPTTSTVTWPPTACFSPFYQTYMNLLEDETPELEEPDEIPSTLNSEDVPATVDQSTMRVSLLQWHATQCTSSEDTSRVVVRRRHVKDDTLRAFKNRSLKGDNALNVYFVGESGVDTGGLTRELFNLVLPQLRDHFLCGDPGMMLPRGSASAIADGTLHAVGKIFAAAVLHGRQSLPFLHPVIAELLISEENPTLHISWIAEASRRNGLQKVNDATTEEDIQNACQQEGCDLVLTEVNWRKVLNLANKKELIGAACKHYLIFDQHAQLNTLLRGMDFYGMKQYAQSYPDCIRSIFGSVADRKLDADQVFDLFDIKYSEEGSNNREKEEATTMHFLDFLEKCGTGDADAGGFTLEDFLEFFTGSKQLLLGGM